MVHGIYVPADNTLPAEGREFTTLENCQTTVGGNIEAVDVLSQGCTIYVNEEGLLHHLPFNPRATFFWWLHGFDVRQRAMLVGDALIIGMPDRDGDSTDIPDRMRELFLHQGSFRVDISILGQSAWERDKVKPEALTDALVWAMLILERKHNAREARIVPFADKVIA